MGHWWEVEKREGGGRGTEPEGGGRGTEPCQGGHGASVGFSKNLCGAPIYAKGELAEAVVELQRVVVRVLHKGAVRAWVARLEKAKLRACLPEPDPLEPPLDRGVE